MQQLVKITVYIFLLIFVITALLTLGGLASLWFWSKQPGDLPYLKWLLTILIAEVIGVVIMVGKRGLLYLPEIRTNKNTTETDSFMRDFVSHGSSVTIVSNRLAWLIDAKEVQKEIIKRAQSGASFEIITAQPIEESLKEPLKAVGVQFFVTGLDDIPEARFTLINANRSGAEKLAIARGTHPNHEITIFDSASGPQIIGLAKDIVRKSKARANATPLG
ncbi:MAG: hypothetical protein WBX02_06365 [Terriglobales bacterium]